MACGPALPSPRPRPPPQLRHRSTAGIERRRAATGIHPRRHPVPLCAHAPAVAVPPAGKRGSVAPATGVQALPEPPKTAGLLDVIPYLGRLALTDPALYWRVGLAMTCLVLSKTAGLVSPFFLKQAVEVLGPMTPAAAKAAALACLLAGLCRVVSGIAKELVGPLFTPVAQAAQRKVASNTFAHVLDLDVQFHLDRRSGTLSRILDRGSRSVQMLFRIVGFTFVPTVIELVLVSGLLGKTFSPVVTFVVIGTFAGYVGWTLYMTQAITQSRKVANEYDNLTTGKAIDALQNFEMVTLFNNQDMEVAQYDEYLRGYQNASIDIEKAAATLNAGQSVVLSMGVTVALVATLMLSGTKQVTPGDLVLIQGLLLQLWYPLQFLGWFYRELKQCLVDMDEFLKIWQTKTMLPEGTLNLPGSIAVEVPTVGAYNGNGASGNGAGHETGVLVNGNKALPPPAIEFNNVTFGYSGERKVLQGFNLKVKPGQSVALVGGSGSGKSTVLRLLARLYDPTEGNVTIDGIDVRDLRHESLRGAIGVVPQDTVLFNASVMDNIRYGRPGASDEEVIAASKMAQLHHSILRMPEAYDTMVGERGLKLSGGEKQRVAIARTFVRAPRLLICDEATSALDTNTEQEIMSSLSRLAEGRTSFFVAHRLSTIVDCDVICVMADGRIIEQGSHEELMGLGRTYRDMWMGQAAGKDLYDKCIPVY
ncbi:unnamed protein product [Ostreobium quekettii]|uniref:Uncharacterized protein n=1 Tax=Ostreobium quekettii TaxID=121088 RepID=A0A8S1IXB1_9CHLO|nr:unnamed protein product [Ostreobium quekettii]|eukprot:evm.model.scf_972.4 EVM.evm.TU.scf_972.4   scf_972:21429-30623(-)